MKKFWEKMQHEQNFLMKLFYSIFFRGIGFNVSLLFEKLVSRVFIINPRNSFLLRIKSFFRLGYLVNLDRSRTFNEKIIKKKLNQNINILAPYADKLKVREIIERKGYPGILNELFFQIDSVAQINIHNLPTSFVMKANHGSGMNKIIKDKNAENPDVIFSLSAKWLKTKYNQSVGGTDFHYDAIEPKIIFEKILENKDGSPLLDYKFYCFNGSVEFIDIVDNSKGIPLMYIYDKKWQQLPFALYNKHLKGNYPKPERLEEMIQIAEDLSKEFDFVRIDLYLIDNKKIVFGEYTFFPGGGMLKFNPRKYDFIYGKKLNIII